MQANLVVNNLLNDRGATYSSTAQSAHVMRPLNNDYTSPARDGPAVLRVQAADQLDADTHDKTVT